VLSRTARVNEAVTSCGGSESALSRAARKSTARAAIRLLSGLIVVRVGVL
jgi:hypothetical protein